jgi:hypothetical protein
MISPLSTCLNHSNLLGFCAVACLHSGRLSLRAQIMYPLLVILALLAATAALALRLDLPGTVVAYYTLPTLAMLVRHPGRPCAAPRCCPPARTLAPGANADPEAAHS